MTETTPPVVRLADGSPAPMDTIARAFGFTSAEHLDDVLAGRRPSALAEPLPATVSFAPPSAHPHEQRAARRREAGRKGGLAARDARRAAAS